MIKYTNPIPVQEQTDQHLAFFWMFESHFTEVKKLGFFYPVREVEVTS